MSYGQPQGANPIFPHAPRLLEIARVDWRFIAIYALAYMGLWMALLPPVLVGLGLRVNELDPSHATDSLSMVMGVGALFALFGNPFFGRLSDRTTSRFGMRRPWLIAGALGGMAGLAIVASAHSIPQILLGWCIAQLAYNAQLAALMAILSDQVAPQHRGLVSGIVGVSQPVGMVAGTCVVQAFAHLTVAMFLAPAAVAVACVICLALALPDRRLDAAQRKPYGWREFATSFWINPLRYPDFGWIWSSRFLLFAGASVLLTYQGLYLIHHLGRTLADVPHLIFVSTLAQSGAVVVFSGLGGRLSDAVGRRKIFVFGAALLYALALLVIAFAPSYAWFLVGMTISGAGLGTYLAVDLALATDVLPDREVHAGKDLGIFNIANVMPQSLMPAVASAVLAASGGTYTVLFIMAAVFVILGAWTIQPVRGTR